MHLIRSIASLLLSFISASLLLMLPSARASEIDGITLPLSPDGVSVFVSLTPKAGLTGGGTRVSISLTGTGDDCCPAGHRRLEVGMDPAF